jgi:hypothetical protein
MYFWLQGPDSKRPKLLVSFDSSVDHQKRSRTDMQSGQPGSGTTHEEELIEFSKVCHNNSSHESYVAVQYVLWVQNNTLNFIL